MGSYLFISVAFPFMANVNLQKASGLPLKLDGNKLIFGKGMSNVIADIRTRERMNAVLKNPNVESPDEFYYMYRNVHRKADEKKIVENNLRYDITILPGFSVGGEFNKTFGHFHPKVLGTDTWYPEVYEVLHGHAHYLLQNDKEFLVFDARVGDKCLMIPGYAHITVNPSETETLVMANWVYPGFESNYKPIEQMGGGEYFETHHGFVPNRKYPQVRHVKLITPKVFSPLDLTKKPLYTEAIEKPEKFAWLSKPQDFLGLFAKYLES